MTRLSHTFDIAPVDRETVDRIVAGLYEVAAACRFDGRGWLITPDEEALSLLVERAGELGLIDVREREKRIAERERAITELREGDPSPGRREELEIQASRLGLQLRSGRHLEPRTRYLVAELSPDGIPVEPGDDETKGWSGTGVAVTSWDPWGRAAIDYAMPDGTGTGEPAVTWGSVAHDGAAGTLDWSLEIRLPGRGARLRSASGALHIDLDAWYATLDGGPVPPVHLSATHAMARVEGWIDATRTPEGRWSVKAVLDVRGRGLYRPFVAAALWATRASFRRQDARIRREGTGEPTTADRLEQAARDWDTAAQAAPQVPDLLADLARVMSEERRRP
ncbi:hypothetical protein PWG71_20280 [Nocardiopsis sp. N85]|uniref:hypothetical protein n=1 Tax=Nocardiopsis sp. N85 TaxID=3029400 RepID=UPI00237F025D|nr:hypothetical protein [Nocardiopsis sp. N85]MDE3723735.1 hypothetical protein [Nocardiopsis sp. N85]